MLSITDRKAMLIRIAGGILVVGGVAFLFLGHGYYFEQLPNYLRLGVLVPILIGKPMLFVNFYRDDWSSLNTLERTRAICFLLAPPAMAIGAFVWYLSDPSAKA